MQVLPFPLLVLLAAALGFILYRRRQRCKQPPTNLSFHPHADASGNFMCFALGQRSVSNLDPSLCHERQ